MFWHFKSGLVHRHPLVGVVLGGLGTVLCGALAVVSFEETTRLGAFGGPQRFALSAAGPLETESQWVTLLDGDWDCRLCGRENHSWTHRWLFGEVKFTEVAVHDATGTRTAVVKLEGDQDCREWAGRAVSGVLLPRPTHFWDRSIAPELRAKLGREPDLVLLAGEGPTTACYRSLGLMVLTGLAGCVLASSWRQWRRAGVADPTAGRSA